MGFRDETRNTGIRRYWPVIGFIMIVMLGAIAYIVAPMLQEATRDLFPQFRTRGVNPGMVRLGFTVVIFVVLAMISAAIVAMMQPKSKLKINDKDLMKIRQGVLQQKEDEKKRMRKVNREMRRH